MRVRPVWTEVGWPFPLDQWGRGRAFQCKAADCGREVKLYLRAKIGFCNCATGVADDAELVPVEVAAPDDPPATDAPVITAIWSYTWIS